MTTSFYADWTFWAFLASAVAILLSQLPPVRTWFKKGRLVTEVHDRIYLTHMIGYQNCQLYLAIRNEGSRAVRIKKIKLAFDRHEQPTSTLWAQSYFVNPADTQAVLLVPFSLAPGAEWGHSVLGFESLVAREDRALGLIRSSLRQNIADKVQARNAVEPENRDLVEADESVLRPIMERFSATFNLHPGEYHVTVSVITDDESTNASSRYRFTLYDPDSEELKRYADGYKYGFGPAIQDERQRGVMCQLYPDGVVQ